MRIWALGLIVILGVGLLGPGAYAQATKAARPTTAVVAGGCVTAQCHANVKAYKVLHGPVNVNACDACHKIDDVSKHTFLLSRRPQEVCTFCHKVETGDAKFVHKPVSTGECLGCHDPHGGTTAKFIRGGAMKDLCAKCHKDVVGTKKMVHGPVAAGACEACHAPHAAKYPKLLVAEGKTLCLSCHKEMGEQLAKSKSIHKPVAEGECSQCHDPHASDFTMQTKAPPLQLCTSCHEHDKVKQAAQDAKYKHSAVTTAAACLNCHTSHGANLAKLMKAQPATLCLKCHDKPIEITTPVASTGPSSTQTAATTGRAGTQAATTQPVVTRTVAGVAEILDPKLSKHGPVKEGNCGGCHNVHGSDVAKLLAKPFPDTFYTSFALDKYSLCFSCHDQRLVELQTTAGLTGFRNGERNLHFVHVNKADKGRTCRACHDTHASAQPMHVRTGVPYGKWELPLNFKKTDTGGSCLPGCHQQFGYDRKEPVENHVPTPAGAPPAATQTTPAPTTLPTGTPPAK